MARLNSRRSLSLLPPRLSRAGADCWPLTSSGVPQAGTPGASVAWDPAPAGAACFASSTSLFPSWFDFLSFFFFFFFFFLPPALLSRAARLSSSSLRSPPVPLGVLVKGLGGSVPQAAPVPDGPNDPLPPLPLSLDA